MMPKGINYFAVAEVSAPAPLKYELWPDFSESQRVGDRPCKEEGSVSLKVRFLEILLLY